MTFGEDFSKFLNKTHCAKIIYILHTQYRMSFTEIGKKIGLRNAENLTSAWELTSNMNKEHMTKLLDLLYEKDRVKAITLMIDVFMEYYELLAQ
jgi:hypothetical protein